MQTQTVYRSSNGDDWLLATDDAGQAFVVHRANASAGGTETTTPVDEFLERNGGSPEAAAVRVALQSGLSSGKGDEEVDETLGGGLEFPPDVVTDTSL